LEELHVGEIFGGLLFKDEELADVLLDEWGWGFVTLIGE
jgi:hypothetical protein